MSKPKPQTCSGCAFASQGISFVPDCAFGPKPIIALWLEAPGAGEVADTQGSMGYGRPLVGPTGRFFDWQVLSKVGLKREHLLIGNTLRCRPPRNEYPTGKTRHAAEEFCRQYDQRIREFNPTILYLTYHPSVCFRSPQLVKFVRATMKKAKRTALLEGERPLVLMGDKAFQLWLSHLKGGLRRWQGHSTKEFEWPK